MKLEDSYKTDGSNDCKALSNSPRDVRKILIVHASVGSGHKSAALAIQKAFEMLDAQAELEAADSAVNGKSIEDVPYYDVEVLDILQFGRIVFNGDNTASMFTGATRPFYDITWRFALTGRLLWGGGTIWARIMFPKFVEYVAETKPDAIICTHITAANVAVSARMLLGETFPIVCVPTDYEAEGLWPHKYTDLFCVANQHMAETLRARKVPESRILVTGIPAAPAFSETYDATECRRQFGLPLDKQVVLFQAGATLPRPYVHFRSAIQEILPYVHRFENMHMAIVAGKDKEYAAQLRRDIDRLGIKNITVFEFVDNMAGLMAASDLIVCKSGGLTVTECLCIGTPMVLMGRAYGQEKSNVTMLTATGSAFHVTTSRELLNLLGQVSKHPEITQAILTNASLIRHPHASFDIARATIQLINDEKDILSPLYRKHFAHFYWGHAPAHTR